MKAWRSWTLILCGLALVPAAAALAQSNGAPLHALASTAGAQTDMPPVVAPANPQADVTGGAAESAIAGVDTTSAITTPAVAPPLVTTPESASLNLSSAALPPASSPVVVAGGMQVPESRTMPRPVTSRRSKSSGRGASPLFANSTQTATPGPVTNSNSLRPGQELNELVKKSVAAVLLLGALLIVVSLFARKNNQTATPAAGAPLELLSTLRLSNKVTVYLLKTHGQLVLVAQDGAGVKQMITLREDFQALLDETPAAAETWSEVESITRSGAAHVAALH